MAPPRLNASILAEQVAAQINAAMPDLIAQVIAGINDRIFGSDNPNISFSENDHDHDLHLFPTTVKQEEGENLGNITPFLFPVAIKQEEGEHSRNNNLPLPPATVQRKESKKRKAHHQPTRSNNNKKPTPGTRTYIGPLPKCPNCSFHHVGNCPVCYQCHRTGHLLKYCPGKADKQVKKRLCHECGSDQHLRGTCPIAHTTKTFSTLAITTEEARQDPNAVTGKSSINDQFVSVLFD